MLLFFRPCTFFLDADVVSNNKEVHGPGEQLQKSVDNIMQ